MDWVKTLPCMVRGRDCFGPIDPHHTARAYGGIKGSDYSVVPLCRHHHGIVQDHPWLFKKLFNFIPDEEYARRTYLKRYNARDDREVIRAF